MSERREKKTKKRELVLFFSNLMKLLYAFLRDPRVSQAHKTIVAGRVLFIPNLMKLLYALLRDPRVSQADKAIVAGVIIYVIVPIDVIPDFIPFIGQVDDAYLVAISLLRLLNRADRSVILDHWKGKPDI